MFTRRAALGGGFALAACSIGPRGEREALAEQRIAAVEARIGGRVGVAAWNTATDVWISTRRHERFAMCSTFKWLLAAQMLQMGERSAGLLDQRVLFNESDLLEYAPTTRARIRETPMGRMGEMTIEELCEAAVVLSDNTAANLLLESAMGPRGFTNFLRANGDAITRLDRIEPDLNEVPPGDERDTTTPEAMARTTRRLLLGHAQMGDPPLNAASREKLIGWMVASTTGLQRLRAGLPADWRVGDKTGTWNGPTNAANDVAICWPPSSPPIVIACYLAQSTADAGARNAAHAEIARIIVEAWG